MRRGQDDLMQGDGYVTAAEVSAATGQTLSTIHRGIEAERIPGGKVGSGWYVAIHEYAEKFSKEGPEATIRTRLDELAKKVPKRAAGKLPIKAVEKASPPAKTTKASRGGKQPATRSNAR